MPQTQTQIKVMDLEVADSFHPVDDWLVGNDTDDTQQSSRGSTRRFQSFNVTAGAEVAKPTGSNDSAQLIELIAKINARGGGKLKAMVGVYDMLNTVNPCDNLELVGEGWGTIFKTHNNTNLHMFMPSSCDNVVFRDFAIDGNKANNQNQTGHLIRIDNTNHIFLEHLYVHDSGLHGIITNINVYDIRINNCLTVDNGVNANGSGIYLNNTLRAIISNHISHGNQLDGVQWKTSDEMQWSNIISYSNGRYGMYAIDGHANISNINLYANSSIGLYAEEGSNANTTINAVGGKIYDNLNDGIRIQDSNSCGLSQLKSFNNGISFTSAGLRLRSTAVTKTCNRNRIMGCEFYDTKGASATQEYGILAIGAGGIDRNIVLGNEMYGNLLAPFQQDKWDANNIYSTSNNIIA